MIKNSGHKLEGAVLNSLFGKKGGNLQEQVLAFLKLVHITEGKVIHPVQVRHAAKVELPQFADNIQQRHMNS